MKNDIQYQKEYIFGEVTIYQDYIYVVMKEGIVVKPEYNDILVTLAEKYFKNKGFVYITHRIHSYSVDPTIYIETAKISNLKGFIVIKPKPDVVDTPKIESLFFNKPFILCKTLDNALQEKNKILK